MYMQKLKKLGRSAPYQIENTFAAVLVWHPGHSAVVSSKETFFSRFGLKTDVQNGVRRRETIRQPWPV